MNQTKSNSTRTSHSQKTMNQWYQLCTKQGYPHISLMGNYTLTALGRIWEPLASELIQQAKNKNLYWDLTGIQQMDTAGSAMLWRVWKAQRPEHLQLRPEHEKMFERLENLPNLQPEGKQRDLLWPITTLGGLALLLWQHTLGLICLLYTSPSPRDRTRSRMPSSA